MQTEAAWRHTHTDTQRSDGRFCEEGEEDRVPRSDGKASRKTVAAFNTCGELRVIYGRLEMKHLRGQDLRKNKIK